MTAPLRRVLVRSPEASFAGEDWRRWGYAGRPELAAARREHEALAALLADAGAEVLTHSAPLPGLADALYVFDPALVTEEGAVILRMGKELRRGEEAGMERCLAGLEVPVLGRLTGEATAEGGDLLWLDETILAAGLGFRTNREGVRQLGEILAPLGVEVVPVELPCFRGPGACLHLLSLISLVDEDLAVVYPELLSVPFWQRLRERGMRMVEVPAEEFPTLGTNVLALAPGRCLMLEGNPVTRKRLEGAGCEVLTFRGEEICLKGEGGPTCLTRPILRRA
jgi:N-dimethylarginine dimethylaminohydrolase